MSTMDELLEESCPKKKKIDNFSSNIARDQHGEQDVIDIIGASELNTKHLDTTSNTTKKETVQQHQTCAYFINKKNRYCRLPYVKGKKYCVEHSSTFEGVDGRKRILCPLDSKHTCYEDQLHKHLKKCNARQDLRPKYFVENINSGDTGHEVNTIKKTPIQEIPKEELFSVIERCRSLYNEQKQYLTKKEVLTHPSLQEAVEKSQDGAPARKHISQQASLIGHMDKNGLLKTSHCYVEFGAGKGGLSHWVQKSLKEDTTSAAQFILVDKSSVRYKMDCYHKGNDQGPIFERLKIDIQHLNLDAVPDLDNNRPVISIGKHLCGNATDFMLRCLVNTLHEKKDHKRYMKGLIVAMCCHHRCDWKSYVGKKFIIDHGFTANEFHIISTMTSWACCGNKAVEDEDYNHPLYGKLRPQDREEIGLQMKRLVDLGRIMYLQENGLDLVELVHFIEKECTPENVCLVAVKSDIKQQIPTDCENVEQVKK